MRQVVCVTICVFSAGHDSEQRDGMCYRQVSVAAIMWSYHTATMLSFAAHRQCDRMLRRQDSFVILAF